MNWTKTYESFIVEAMTSIVSVDTFEELIDLPKGVGIITDIKWDSRGKVLHLALVNKINSFDLSGTQKAIEKNKSEIIKEFPGIKDVQLGLITIRLT